MGLASKLRQMHPPAAGMPAVAVGDMRPPGPYDAQPLSQAPPVGPHGPYASGMPTPGSSGVYPPAALATGPVNGMMPPYPTAPPAAVSPPAASPLARKVSTLIQQNGLHAFYPPDRLQAVVHRLHTIDFDRIATQWRLPKEIAYDLAALALYDIVFYCDNSGSMQFEDNGDRIDDLKAILAKVADIAALFDDDGITIKFMNNMVTGGDGIRSAAQAIGYVDSVKFGGSTPLGTNLHARVIKPLVLDQALARTLRKPVLVVCITDGEPSEPRDTFKNVIGAAKKQLNETPYGSGALAVQIAQVGRDKRAQQFLEALDKDPVVGGMIDCTSYYEMEEEEYARQGITLTPDQWVLKVCVGAIDPDYDSKDS